MKLEELLDILLAPDFRHETASQEIKDICASILKNKKLLSALGKPLTQRVFPNLAAYEGPTYDFHHHMVTKQSDLTRILLNDPTVTLVVAPDGPKEKGYNGFFWNILAKNTAVKQLRLSPETSADCAADLLNLNPHINELNATEEHLLKISAERLKGIKGLQLRYLRDHNKFAHMKPRHMPRAILKNLVDFIIENNTLHALGLQSCSISENEADLLGMLLRFSTGLQVLDLSYNPLKDRGMQKIIEGLKHNSNLKVLDASATAISKETSLNLLEIAVTHPQMQYLTATIQGYNQEEMQNILRLTSSNTVLQVDGYFVPDEKTKNQLALSDKFIETNGKSYHISLENLKNFKLMFENLAGPYASLIEPSFIISKDDKGKTSSKHLIELSEPFKPGEDKELEEVFNMIFNLQEPFLANLKSINVSGSQTTVKFGTALLPSLTTYLNNQGQRRHVTLPSNPAGKSSFKPDA